MESNKFSIIKSEWDFAFFFLFLSVRLHSLHFIAFFVCVNECGSVHLVEIISLEARVRIIFLNDSFQIIVWKHWMYAIVMSSFTPNKRANWQNCKDASCQHQNWFRFLFISTNTQKNVNKKKFINLLLPSGVCVFHWNFFSLFFFVLYLINYRTSHSPSRFILSHELTLRSNTGYRSIYSILLIEAVSLLHWKQTLSFSLKLTTFYESAHKKYTRRRFFFPLGLNIRKRWIIA